MENKIDIRLIDIYHSTNWDEFCTKYGYSYYCMDRDLKNGVNHHIMVNIKKDDALKWNLIR